MMRKLNNSPLFNLIVGGISLLLCVVCLVIGLTYVRRRTAANREPTPTAVATATQTPTATAKPTETTPPTETPKPTVSSVPDVPVDTGLPASLVVTYRGPDGANCHDPDPQEPWMPQQIRIPYGTELTVVGKAQCRADWPDSEIERLDVHYLADPNLLDGKGRNRAGWEVEYNGQTCVIRAVLTNQPYH